MASRRYKAVLVEFMSFNDGQKYSQETEFSERALLAVTPEAICRWMNTKTYGELCPADNDKPLHARSSTLEFAKKAISSFMVRKTMQWDPVRSEGNPTRSEAVNTLIKRVKKFEVRREGVQSNARRPIEYDEFIRLLTLIRSQPDKDSICHLASSVLTLQWHLIGRIDDMMKLKFDNVTANIQHPGTLLCQMRWSKNISEERDAPEQVILASMDPRVCALLNLAVYIEASPHLTGSEFVFGNPDAGHRVIRRFLDEVFNSDKFQAQRSGNLGTHSLRKGAATYSSRCGVPKDFINRRGRWRTRKSIVDIYIDNTQPYPDAVAAGSLTGPLGPCFYSLREGMQSVSTELLTEKIACHAKQVFGDEIAKILALSLLWAALTPPRGFDFELIPSRLRERIIQQYVDAGGDRSINPVNRVGVHIVGDGAQLQLIGMVEAINEAPVAVCSEHDATSMTQSGASLSMTGDSTRKEFAGLHMQFFALKRSVANVADEILRLRAELQRENAKLLAVTHRIAAQPVVRSKGKNSVNQPASTSSPARNENDVHTAQHHAARLSKRPRDLYELWHEYEFGYGGSKPAKEFTPSERGACKSVYCRRKRFWDVVARLVRAGFTSDVAIDKIYAAYGRRQAVTDILEALRLDKRNGHPSLRV